MAVKLCGCEGVALGEGPTAHDTYKTTNQGPDNGVQTRETNREGSPGAYAPRACIALRVATSSRTRLRISRQRRRAVN